MADEKGEKEKRGSYAPSAFIALVVALGIVLPKLPLTSARDPDPSLATPNSRLFQSVPVRLWQDPLSPSIDYKEKDGAKARDTASIQQDFASTFNRACPKVDADESAISALVKCATIKIKGQGLGNKVVDFKVLAVTIPAGNYAEDIEQRRRTRYAVLSALSDSSFTPSDPDRIGIVPIKFSSDGEPTNVPYELYLSSRDVADAKKRAILVVWLSSEAFEQAPLRSIWQMASASLRGRTAGTNVAYFEITDDAKALAGRSRFRLLDDKSLGVGKLSINAVGPTHSDALRNLYEEVDASGNVNPSAGNAPKTVECVGEPIRIWSPFASASDRRLWPVFAGEKGRMKRDEAFKSACVIFQRVGASDDQLVKLIVDELQMRGALPGRIVTAGEMLKSVLNPPFQPVGAGGHLVLLSEVDSVYGRAFKEELERSVEALDRPARGQPSKAGCKFACEKGIKEYHYLRGLDGELPQQNGKTENKARDSLNPKERSRLSLPFDEINQEYPRGNQQLDYLRRLAEQLKELERKEGIAAIGIVGSDVYDKLLILQALRPQFPSTVFFTTDLDARLFDRSQIRHTRNLVVSSAFGLIFSDQKNEASQSMPPFRDTYQTAAYLSTWAIAKEMDHDRQYLPQIFEIGRSGPTKLPLKGDAISLDSKELNETHTTRLGLQIVLLTFVAALFLFPANFRKIKNAILRFWHAESRRTMLLASFASAILTYLFFNVVRFWDSFLLEPFSLDGISIWPSVLLRFCAVVVCVAFVISSFVALGNSNRALGSRYFSNMESELGVEAPLPVSSDGLALQYQAQIADGGAGSTGLPAERSGRPARVSRWLSSEVRRYVRLWLWKIVHLPDGDREGSISAPRATDLWEMYVAHLASGPLMWRAGFLTTFFMLIEALALVAEPPHVPLRSDEDFVKIVVFGFFFASQIIFLFLLAMVTDIALWTSRFIKSLSAPSTLQWDVHTLTSLGAKPKSWFKNGQYLRDYASIRLIGARTESIGKLVYYPFVCLALMIVSASTVFDNWDWPIGVVLPFAITLGAMILCLGAMRARSEGARRIALRRLNESYLGAIRDGDEVASRQIESAIKYVERTDEGAFGPFSQQPLMKAVLLPFSAYGGVSLMEYLLVFNL
jgi:hypothetical protein